MKKLIHYILIGIMLNWNVAVFAEDHEPGCKWEIVEETEQYLQERCGDYMARIRSKPIDDSIVFMKQEEKKENPIQEFKDKVEEAPKIAEKVEKIEKVQEQVIITEKKIEKLKVEKAVEEKQKI